MEVLIVGFLVLLVFAVIGVITYAFRSHRASAWEAFAARANLTHEPGGLFEAPKIVGRWYHDFDVCVTTESEGSGNSRQEFTVVSADFRAPAPSGLKVAQAGFGASLAVLFGGQDIEVGLTEVDVPLRIQGDVPEEVRRWFRRPAVAATVLTFVTGRERATIRDAAVRISWKGFETNPGVLDVALKEVVDVVREIEEGGRWKPGAEEPFQVRPGRRPGAPRPAPAPAGPRAPEPGLSSAADELVAALASEGQAESAGGFTLDREVARERMREFQLAAPELYVVSLLQAAVCKGAKVVDATIDADDVILSFDGRPFTLEDFEQLYAAMFADAREPDRRARQHLALGVSAAVGVGPRYVSVRSGDGRTGAELRLRPGEPDHFESITGEVPDRTEIHVKLTLGKALGSLHHKVEEVLRRAGRYARLVLDVNGERVSLGFAPAGVHGRVALAWEGYEGFCGFDPQLEAAAEVRLVMDGAWVATEAPSAATPGLLAVVESDRLRPDLSGQAVVRDDAWRSAFDAVAEAEPRALQALAAELARRGDRRGPPVAWATALLRTALRCDDGLDAFAPGGASRPLAEALAWPVASGGLTSLAALLDEREREGRLVYTDVTVDELGVGALSRSPLSFDPALAVAVCELEAQDRAFLVHLFGETLTSGTAELLGLTP